MAGQAGRQWQAREVWEGGGRSALDHELDPTFPALGRQAGSRRPGGPVEHACGLGGGEEEARLGGPLDHVCGLEGDGGEARGAAGAYVRDGGGEERPG